MATAVSNRNEEVAAITTRMRCPTPFLLFFCVAPTVGAPPCSNDILWILLGSCRGCSWNCGPRGSGVKFHGWILFRLGREGFVSVECVCIAPVLMRRCHVNDSQYWHRDGSRSQLGWLVLNLKFQ